MHTCSYPQTCTSCTHTHIVQQHCKADCLTHTPTYYSYTHLNHCPPLPPCTHTHTHTTHTPVARHGLFAATQTVLVQTAGAGLVVEIGIHGQRLRETDVLLSLDGLPLTRHLQPLDVHAQALGQLANQKSRAMGSHIAYCLAV